MGDPKGKIPTAPATATERPSTENLVAVKGCNVFLPNTKEPLRDENGQLVVDEAKKEYVFASGHKARVRTANVTGTPRYGAVCHLTWAQIDNYNGGEPFVDAIMID